MRGTLRRILAIADKEVRHIRRDPFSLALALAMPVAMIVLFGFGVSFDLDHLNLRIIDQDQSMSSRHLARQLNAGGEFETGPVLPADADAFGSLRAGRAVAVLTIPAGFERAIRRRERPNVQLLVDGADASTATQLRTKAETAIAVFVARLSAPSRTQGSRVEARTWSRFNPAGRSVVYLLPGIAALVLAMVAVLLTALTIAREWERGSMAQLFATPVRRIDIVFGKLLPYVVLGGLAVLLVIAAGMAVFDVPFRGTALALTLLSLVFLVGMLGQGLLISVLTKNQMVATQVATMSSMLPSLLLSGFMFPIDNMPIALQRISAAVPARYYVEGLRSVLLRGGGLDEVRTPLLALLAFATVVLTLSTLRFQRRIA